MEPWLSDLPADLRCGEVRDVLWLALQEDLSPQRGHADGLLRGDITTQATLAPEARLRARIYAKAEGVLAGAPVAETVFRLLDGEAHFQRQKSDGEPLRAGDEILTVEGSGQALLAAERTALNFLGRMSGIATLTRRYVDAVAGTGAVILDTRKTAPGLRRFDKYAVRMGGGQNHRMGLYDMVLIKDNHIDAAGSITAAVGRVRERFGDRYPIEVEVKTLDELQEALLLRPDRIMLDNMSLETMRRAVELAAGRVPLEASGNVSLETVRAIAETGVDYISVGALTHSAPVLDVSMRLE